MVELTPSAIADLTQVSTQIPCLEKQRLHTKSTADRRLVLIHCGGRQGEAEQQRLQGYCLNYSEYDSA